MPGTTDPEGRPEIDIERGEGATPAMNRPGRKADDDRRVTPGNLGWDEPSSEADQNLARAVRSDEDAQNGEPARLPSEAAGAD